VVRVLTGHDRPSAIAVASRAVCVAAPFTGAIVKLVK
jgi:hypothetical protein